VRRVVHVEAAVAAALLLFGFVACRKEEGGPEPVVECFLQALNAKDVNVVLGCIDPRQERMFRASFRLVEKFTGGKLPVEDLLELVPGLYQILQNKLAADFSFRNVQVYRAKTNGGDTEVPVLLTTSTRTGAAQQDQVQRVRFILREFEEGWRIVGIQQ
jgi:hypothetical protein